MGKRTEYPHWTFSFADVMTQRRRGGPGLFTQSSSRPACSQAAGRPQNEQDGAGTHKNHRSPVNARTRMFMNSAGDRRRSRRTAHGRRPASVGAVRMVTAATGPGEIVSNVYLGEHLHDEQEGVYAALGMRATRESRPTKEYPRGQEVYVLRFGEGFA